MSPLSGPDDLVEVDSSLLRELQRLEADYGRAEESALVAVWRWNAATDVMTWSSELPAMLGVAEDELEPTSAGLSSCVLPGDADRVERFVDEVLTRGQGSTVLRVRRGDGGVGVVEVRAEQVADTDGPTLEVHGTARDRTEVASAGRELHEVTEALDLLRSTMAAIRSAGTFDDALRAALGEICRHQGWTSAVLWEHGSGSTDGATCTVVHGTAVGSLPSPLVGEAATSGHAVWAAIDDGPVATERAVLAAPLTVGGDGARVVEFHGRHATRDVRVAGAVERICFVLALFHRDAEVADHPAARDDELHAALDEAIRNDELRLVYQPKISFLTNRIIGLEALVRWERPGHGLVPPAEFIPHAEASGLVLAIGEWVLTQACRDSVVWQRTYPSVPFMIAVNVSARQFGPGLVDAVRAAVETSGIDPATIRLEVTETTVMDDLDASIRVLHELKSLGATISLDDFGTGHSSLEYLHRMPIDEIKIDRSFVSGLGTNSVDNAIVASVINLAHAMQCEVVSEGVESMAQFERLRDLGCDAAQGYLIARPLEPAQVAEHLAADAAGDRWPREAWPTDATASHETVLVVDDATDVRMLATLSLRAAGLRTHEAGSGATAIALCQRIRPDCVVLDINLPDMSGVEVCRRLRADPATADCTIVMLTSRAERSDKAEAYLSGADDYIVKPFAPRDLIGRVRVALRARQDLASTYRQVESDR